MKRSIHLAIWLCISPVALFSAPVHAGGAVTPRVVELVIQPGNSGSADFHVAIPPMAPSYEPLDIAFVFDGTGSMHDEIADFQRSIDTILNHIARRSTNVRYAIAQFGDHADIRPCSGPGAGANLPVWQLLTDFTPDPAIAKSAVSRTDTPWHGCDTPEAYLEALAEARQLSWRPEATKFVVIVGDAEARSPDRGYDDVIGTEDDLDFKRVTDSYRSDGITIVGIFAPGGPEVARSFALLAEPTPNGMAIPLDRGTSVANAIEKAILLPAVPPPAPYMRGITPGLLQWLRSPHREAADAAGLRYTFKHPVAVPEGTSSGIYKLDVGAFSGPDGDGRPIGVGRIILRVGWEFYPIRSVLQWLVVALMVAALMTSLAYRSRSLSWGLEFRGVALKQAAKTYLLASLIIAAGIFAWRSMPEDYNSFIEILNKCWVYSQEIIVSVSKF